MNALNNGIILQGSKYQILRMLGQGGFGITYEGIQIGLNRKIAIKEFFMGDLCYRQENSSDVMASTPNAYEIISRYRDKFYKEARTIAMLSHQHIVKIIDVFYENNTVYYVMEHITGGSLSDLVHRRGHLQESEAWNIIRQIGDALSYIHQHNILHLDIKPDNIMLRTTGEAVLIDFGIAKQYDATGAQMTATPIGLTRGYAPIEQYYENGVSIFTPATDVYSLGATMLYLLTGNRPPEAQDVANRGLPPFPSYVSLGTQQAITAAMQPLVKNRIQNVRDFITWQEVEEITDVNGTPQMRFVIEQLERQGAYKDAYNRCVDCINRGVDTEYARNKCSTLLPIIKKKARIRNNIMYTIAFIMLVLSIVLSIIVSVNR